MTQQGAERKINVQHVTNHRYADGFSIPESLSQGLAKGEDGNGVPFLNQVSSKSTNPELLLSPLTPAGTSRRGSSRLGPSPPHSPPSPAIGPPRTHTHLRPVVLLFSFLTPLPPAFQNRVLPFLHLLTDLKKFPSGTHPWDLPLSLPT